MVVRVRRRGGGRWEISEGVGMFCWMGRLVDGWISLRANLLNNKQYLCYQLKALGKVSV